MGAVALAEVTPTWALMPRLQDAVWDGVRRPVELRSDSSDKSEGWRPHLETGSILTPLSDPPSDLLTSDPGHTALRSTVLCF